LEFSRPRQTVKRVNLISEILDTKTKANINDKNNILDLIGSKNN